MASSWPGPGFAGNRSMFQKLQVIFGLCDAFTKQLSQFADLNGFTFSTILVRGDLTIGKREESLQGITFKNAEFDTFVLIVCPSLKTREASKSNS